MRFQQWQSVMGTVYLCPNSNFYWPFSRDVCKFCCRSLVTHYIMHVCHWSCWTYNTVHSTSLCAELINDSIFILGVWILITIHTFSLICRGIITKSATTIDKKEVRCYYLSFSTDVYHVVYSLHNLIRSLWEFKQLIIMFHIVENKIVECGVIYFFVGKFYFDKSFISIFSFFIVLLARFIIQLHSVLTFFFVKNSQAIRVINNSTFWMNYIINIDVISEADKGNYPFEFVVRIIKMFWTSVCIYAALAVEQICMEY